MNEVCLNNHQGSHLYNINSSVNNIVAAASPIISLLTRVQGIDPNTTEPESWQELCRHELQVCLDLCEKNGYEDLSTIASVLTTWINSTCIWQYHSEYQKFDSKILNQKLQDPEKHLHILELIYILNRLGMPIEQNSQLNELKTQELFYAIQTKRQITKNALEKQTKVASWHSATSSHKSNNRKWFLFLSFGMLACLWGLWQIWLSLTTFMKLVFSSSQVF